MIKKFSLPGWFGNTKFCLAFLEYYYANRELFYPDRIIDSFYDADDTILWRGGRYYIAREYFPMPDIIEGFNMYPHIKLRHTFTNCLITETLVNDFRCNQFVKKFIRPQDEVILNHPLLIEHFRKHYPNIPIIYSTTLNIKNIDEINSITEHNIYVMNYNYNNDNEYIKQLIHPNNIEVLCAEPCAQNCPYRMQHYINISKDVLGISDIPSDATCPSTEARIFTNIMKQPHFINNDRVEELSEMGINYFKISGRSIAVPQWLETILYYLALPEHRNYIRQILLNKWW